MVNTMKTSKVVVGFPIRRMFDLAITTTTTTSTINRQRRMCVRANFLLRESRGYCNDSLTHGQINNCIVLTNCEGVAGGALLADGDAIPCDRRIRLREEAARGAAVDGEAVAEDGGARGLFVGLDAAEALRLRRVDEESERTQEQVARENSFPMTLKHT